MDDPSVNPPVTTSPSASPSEPQPTIAPAQENPVSVSVPAEPIPAEEARPDSTILAAPEPVPETPTAPPEPVVVQPSPPPIPEPTINIEPVPSPVVEPTPEVFQPEPEIPSQPPLPSTPPETRMSTEELLVTRQNDLQNQVDQALKLELDQRRQKANQTRTDQRNERLNKIIQFVQSHGPINNQDVRDLLHVSQSTATDYLKSLVGRGILKMEKKSNFTTYH